MVGATDVMTEACYYLHESLSRLPRLKREDLSLVPMNGIYVLFENGEEAHGGDRIVRVGTHRGVCSLLVRVSGDVVKANCAIKSETGRDRASTRPSSAMIADGRTVTPR
jgi:hypothetical protein